ncbi:MAG TPA: hypothetical protein VMX12_04140 [Acidimicrobiia bacterium]|nr:hypothetical protein [Acidimicrobiia bacterium]
MTVTANVLTNARSWASWLSRRTAGGSTRPRRHVHRFDGERAFVARGGATVGNAKAAWSMAELAVSSTRITLRSRPRGLFDDVHIDRNDVTSIGARPSELGTGITFGSAHPDVAFWPTDTREVLEALRDRGWPVGRAD